MKRLITVGVAACLATDAHAQTAQDQQVDFFQKF
jgi:hypothetical protein